MRHLAVRCYGCGAKADRTNQCPTCGEPCCVLCAGYHMREVEQARNARASVA
jgi:hypothetical protein